MRSRNEVERERYQARLKWERDQTAFIDEAHELGREEGLEAGREVGELVGRIHLCQRIFKLPLTPRNELCALSLDELRKLADQLQSQLGVAG